MKLDRLAQQYWWKILAVMLLSWGVIGGLLIPIGPSVVKVDKTINTEAGTALLVVQVDQMHLDKGTKVWVMNEEKDFECTRVTSVSANEIHCSLKLFTPFVARNQNRALDIVVNNDIDGTFGAVEILTIPLGTVPDSIQLFDDDRCGLIANTNDPQYISFPNREQLRESIRNLLFHVPMWFAMMFLLLASLIWSIQYLNSSKMVFDQYAALAAKVGFVFGLLGLVTGMLWANFTWGKPWVNDPKLNGAAVGMLVYAAYLVLRASVDDDNKRARLSAVYNIFAFVIYMVFIGVIPRLNDSLHPGNGGNPAFSSYDLDHTLKLFFYPIVAGFILLGFWLMSIWRRLDVLQEHK